MRGGSRIILPFLPYFESFTPPPFSVLPLAFNDFPARSSLVKLIHFQVPTVSVSIEFASLLISLGDVISECKRIDDAYSHASKT